MKAANKYFLLISMALTNGLTHGNDTIYRYLNIATTFGMVAGGILLAVDGNLGDNASDFGKSLTGKGTAIFFAANSIKILLRWNKYLANQEKNHKELIAIQQKNLEASQAMLKKLEKKETESEGFHENTK